MSCKQIEMSSIALVKLQLHLAKYPHCAVNGLFLACLQRLKDDQVIEIVDVVPLFHQGIQLTPMLEIALINVDSHCSSKNLYIAGYYEAAEQLGARPEPSQFSIRIADKIKSYASESRLVIIDNRKVPSLESLKFFSLDSNKKWLKANDEIIFEENASQTLRDLLDRKVYRELVDFDNHLSDISQHWLNQPINRLIRMS